MLDDFWVFHSKDHRFFKEEEVISRWLGWQPGTFAQVETSHFSIYSTAMKQQPDCCRGFGHASGFGLNCFPVGVLLR